MKRFVCILLMLVLLSGNVAAFAAEDVDFSQYSIEDLITLRNLIDARIVEITSNVDYSDYSLDGLLYVSNGSEIRINSYEGSTSELVIPSEIDGIPVTQIHEDAFENNKSIQSAILPSKISVVPSHAFYWCENLRSVVLPENLKEIGSAAFYNCPLKSIILPDGLEEIRDSAFLYSGLNGILAIPESVQTIDTLAFAGCSDLRGLILQGDVTINGEAFGHYGTPRCGIKFVYIKEGCTVHFKDNVFCEDLEVAVIPASVTSIDENTFAHCNKLTIVTPAGSYAETYAKEHWIMCDTSSYDQYVAEYTAYLDG